MIIRDKYGLKSDSGGPITEEEYAQHLKWGSSKPPASGVSDYTPKDPEPHREKKEEKPRGFWSSFFEWCGTPYSRRSHFSRTDPRLMLILVIAAVAFMAFGGMEGLLGGAFVLWYLATMIIPCVYGERLDQRFGPKWGIIIAYAPLWVPIVLGLSAGLWLPLFGIH